MDNKNGKIWIFAIIALVIGVIIGYLLNGGLATSGQAKAILNSKNSSNIRFETTNGVVHINIINEKTVSDSFKEKISKANLTFSEQNIIPVDHPSTLDVIYDDGCFRVWRIDGGYFVQDCEVTGNSGYYWD
ncbi:MAG: hypothetical protein V1824_01935 [archaeon]